MPRPLAETAHVGVPLLFDLSGEHRPEAVPPEAHRLVAEVDTALRQEVLHVTKAERKADVQHYGRADHLGRRIETAEWVGWSAGSRHGSGLADQAPIVSGAFSLTEPANGFVRNRAARVAGVNRPNERSLSFLITMGDFDYLVSGDLTRRAFGSEDAEVEQAVAEALVADGIDLDILHVNHHGANNGSSKEFLELLRPEIAIISAGNGNSHHHPHEEVLERFIDAGVDRIFQTSWGTTTGMMPLNIRDYQAIWQQDIVTRTDGGAFWIETSRRWRAE